MAVQTRTYCFYCSELVWTINNDLKAHYVNCSAKKNKEDRRQSSVRDWELKEIAERTKEWKNSENK